jgi:hypothetical protein
MSKEVDQQNSGDQNIIEFVALFKTGRIKRKDMDENNESSLNYYLGVIEEDPKFTEQVSKRMYQLTEGEKIPLFTDEQINQLKRHKRYKKHNSTPASQPELWPKKPTSINKTDLSSIIEPNKKIFQLGKDLNKKYYRHIVSPVTEDVRYKELELRTMIGLPIARGKDPHINDEFYKFLIRRICKYDIFGIFLEYDRTMVDIPERLNTRIKEVAGLVDKLLNKDLDRTKRYKEFYQFLDEYRDKWSLPQE